MDAHEYLVVSSKAQAFEQLKPAALKKNLKLPYFNNQRGDDAEYKTGMKAYNTANRKIYQLLKEAPEFSDERRFLNHAYERLLDCMPQPTVSRRATSLQVYLDQLEALTVVCEQAAS